MSTSVLEMFSLKGKTAFLTGGTRGIGAAMAIGLAEAGADLILIQVFSALRSYVLFPLLAPNHHPYPSVIHKGSRN